MLPITDHHILSEITKISAEPPVRYMHKEKFSYAFLKEAYSIMHYSHTENEQLSNNFIPKVLTNKYGSEQK